MNDKLKWYVVWYPEVNGWAVMLGDFRNSWQYQKYQAESYRDWLESFNNHLHL